MLLSNFSNNWGMLEIVIHPQSQIIGCTLYFHIQIIRVLKEIQENKGNNIDEKLFKKFEKKLNSEEISKWHICGNCVLKKILK